MKPFGSFIPRERRSPGLNCGSCWGVSSPSAMPWSIRTAGDVIHRDLKPANIMLGKFGETLVVDWGLAKTLGQASTFEAVADEGPLRTEVAASNINATREGAVIGTPTMMSPEQAAGLHEQMGPAADIFSLGATLYQILAGIPPYRGSTLNDVLAQARRGQVPPPRQTQPAIPRALEAICLKAMAVRPEDRYLSAKALADDVEHWLADEPVSAYADQWLERAFSLGAAAQGARALGDHGGHVDYVGLRDRHVAGGSGPTGI